MFTRDAVTLIYEHSQGIPRTISVICDNALVSGLALGRRPIDRAIVLEVCTDFDLQRAADTSAADAPEVEQPPAAVAQASDRTELAEGEQNLERKAGLAGPRGPRFRLLGL